MAAKKHHNNEPSAKISCCQQYLHTYLCSLLLFCPIPHVDVDGVNIVANAEAVADVDDFVVVDAGELCVVVVVAPAI